MSTPPRGINGRTEEQRRANAGRLEKVGKPPPIFGHIERTPEKEYPLAFSGPLPRAVDQRSISPFWTTTTNKQNIQPWLQKQLLNKRANNLETPYKGKAPHVNIEGNDVARTLFGKENNRRKSKKSNKPNARKSKSRRTRKN
jgi:hypothetical protein